MGQVTLGEPEAVEEESTPQIGSSGQGAMSMADVHEIGSITRAIQDGWEGQNLGESGGTHSGNEGTRGEGEGD